MEILGHRGTGVTSNHVPFRDKRHKPENTLASYRAALDAGVYGIEIDLQLTADGEVVCIHDKELNLHVAGANPARRNFGLVSKRTYADMQNLDLGQGEKLPRLEDVFALAAGYPGAILNLDLKDRAITKAVLDKVRHLCGKYAISPDRIIYVSNHIGQLKDLRRLDPGARIIVGVFSRLPFWFPVRGNHTPAWHKPLADAFRRADRLWRKAEKKFSDTIAMEKESLGRAIDEVKPEAVSLYLPEITDDMIAFLRQKKVNIFAWTMREHRPESDRMSLNFVEKHRHDPDIYMITDYPAAMLRVKKNGPPPPFPKP